MLNTSQQQISDLSLSPALHMVMKVGRVQAILSRRFDRVGNGLGFTDFIILYHLYAAEEHKLRRIDLAEKLGLTASGVTKLLPPMEKIGLVGRESNPRDARVSYVVLAPGGKTLFEHSIEQANYLAETVIPSKDMKRVPELVELLEDIRRLAAHA